MFRSICMAGVVAAALFAGTTRADEAQDALALKAYGVLKQQCFRCHGVNFEVPGFHVLDRDALTQVRSDQEDPYITPGDVEKSTLWQRMGVEQDMPPSKVKERPTAEDMATIKQWIEAGAPKWRAPAERSFKTEQWVLEKIEGHLSKVAKDDRRHQRYFSLVHLYNNPQVTDDELRLYRAAFAKLINSTSRKAKRIEPLLIDAGPNNPYDGLIFNVNLLDVGWKLEDWQKLIKTYPYGVSWNDTTLQDLTEEIGDKMGQLDFEGVPYYRVDWFINTASRPPHYHNLLALEDTALALETRLGVDVEGDFKNDRVKRAGFAGSGVSKNNRLIDRHEGNTTPYYYKSYDFGKSFSRGVLFRFPLGPKFADNQFPDQAFEHDGGEIIYALPNGMQAYLLVDTEGKRIDKGPINIVRDLNEHAGTPEITNGISCMGCHKHGMLAYKDTIRDGVALTGEARRKLDRLFTNSTQLSQIVEQDRQAFLTALDRITGPYLKQGEDKDKKIEQFPEVISAAARLYAKDIGLSTVVAELNLEDARRFNVDTNDKLQAEGLGPLSQNGTIPRAMWDSLDESSGSVFQSAIVALRLGRGIQPK